MYIFITTWYFVYVFGGKVGFSEIKGGVNFMGEKAISKILGDLISMAKKTRLPPSMYSNPPIYGATIWRFTVSFDITCLFVFLQISCFTIEHVLTFPRFTVPPIHFCFPPRITVNRGITVYHILCMDAIKQHWAYHG